MAGSCALFKGYNRHAIRPSENFIKKDNQITQFIVIYMNEEGSII